MRYKNLTLIGTSHIARQSIKEVREAIESNNPDIVAVELDAKRLYAMQQKTTSRLSVFDIGRIGLQGYLFTLIGGYVQKKLGNIVNVKPGSDMMAAINTAKKIKADIALIDQDIEITLKRFSKALSWKEKWRFVVDIFNGIFFKKRELKKIGLDSFDLSTVPANEVIKKMIGHVKKRYPNIHRVLIKERNQVMAKKLFKLMRTKKKIVAVVGAGHEEDMLKIIKRLEQSNITF